MKDLIRLACVGGSITFGLGLPSRRETCYPAVLQTLLGDQFQVRNFGYSGAAVGQGTNEPYTGTPSFTAVNRFEPQAVVIALGTNDAQFANLDQLPHFPSDFGKLIEHFASLPTQPRLALVLPPPVFEPLPAIDIATLDATVRPVIAQIALEQELPVIDAYTPLLGKRDWFPDNLHPNVEGSRLIAELVADAIGQLSL